MSVHIINKFGFAIAILAALLVNTAKSDVDLWVGGSYDEGNWCDTIYSLPDSVVNVKVWFQCGVDDWVGDIGYPLGINKSYIDQFDAEACSLYYPLTEWDINQFTGFNDEYIPNHSSLTFFGIARTYPPDDNPWLHYVSPTHILTFTVHATDNSDLIGSTYCDALVQGLDPITGVPYAGDTLGASGYTVYDEYACVSFQARNFGYIQGEVSDGIFGPIEDVHVEVLGTDVDDYTNTNGEYYLDYVLPGTYELSFSHSDYCDTNIIDVTVTEYAPTYLDVIMNRGGYVAGVVVDEVTQNPIPSVHVDANPGSAGDITDIDGTYLLYFLCRSSYSVSFSHPDYSDTTLNGISVTAYETTYVDVEMRTGGAIKGRVTNQSSNPVAGIVVTSDAGSTSDITDSNGDYIIGGQKPGSFNVYYRYSNNNLITFREATVAKDDTIIIDVTICQASPDNVYLWLGGTFANCAWRDTVYTLPDSLTEIKVWAQTGPDVWVADFLYPLGINKSYLNWFDSAACSYNYPLTEWDVTHFWNFSDEYIPNHASFSYVGFANIIAPPYDNPWLHIEIPTHIFTYVAHAVDNEDLLDLTFCDALIQGVDPVVTWPYAGDTVGGYGYTIYDDFACVHFGMPEYAGALSGTIFNDANGDGDQDGNEDGLPGWMVIVNPGNLAAYSNQNGEFIFYMDEPGTYTVSEVLIPDWEQTSPSPSGSYTVGLTEGEIISNLDFGNRVLYDYQDLSISVSGTRARPGFNKVLGIVYFNKGTIITGAVVSLLLPPEVIHTMSSDGGIYEPGDHKVTWYVGTLNPGFSGWLTTEVIVPVSVPLGTILTSTAQIDPIPGDFNPADNISIETQVVCGSFDPNEKHVTPDGQIRITENLAYKIDFQNVGTDTAFNIVVRDSLDLNLDVTTLALGASSHPYDFSFEGREMIWTFTNINLPDSIINEPGSHGFITYAVLPVSTILEGSIIENRAAIYFDFNPPVITNTVINIIGPDAYSYLPGDVNMAAGTWPPVCTGPDVTYLVNYFRSVPTSLPCKFDGDLGLFWASADANGDCNLIGSDVTKLVGTFRGVSTVLHCEHYPPAWATPQDVPAEAPPGWPNCE